MAKVEMYATMWCPFCARARALLEKKGVDYTEFDIDEEPRRQARPKAGDRRMSTTFTAACIQFTAAPDPEPNLRAVGDLVRRARDGGADLIMTPEASNLIESGRRRRDKARREADDPFLAGMRELARELGIWLLLGS